MATWAQLAKVEVHRQVELTTLLVYLHARHVHAQVNGWDVDQPRLLVVAHRHPVLATDQVRADIDGLALEARTERVVRCFDRHAGLQIDASGPVHAINTLFGGQHLAVRTINDVEEAVTVRRHNDWNSLAVEWQVSKHQLVDAVIVPCVMWCVLIVPLDLTGVGVQSNNRCGVQVAVLADVGDAVKTNTGIVITGDRKLVELTATDLVKMREKETARN